MQFRWLHASEVQVTGAPTHEPLLSQASPYVQALPSLQRVPGAAGTCETPVTGSQESAVHGYPSSITKGVPGRQVPPPSHSSRPLQTFPSEQDVPAETGRWRTPVTGSQLSAVHGLPSSMGVARCWHE